jgi:hypothetical protein
MSNAEWITDRPPTEADGDMDGDVRMKLAPNAGLEDWACVHWGYVGDAAPWQHTSYWEPPAQPTPTETDRIAALEQRVAELEATMRQLLHGSRFRLVVEPR